MSDMAAFEFKMPNLHSAELTSADDGHDRKRRLQVIPLSHYTLHTLSLS